MRGWTQPPLLPACAHAHTSHSLISPPPPRSERWPMEDIWRYKNFRSGYPGTDFFPFCWIQRYAAQIPAREGLLPRAESAITFSNWPVAELTYPRSCSVLGWPISNGWQTQKCKGLALYAQLQTILKLTILATLALKLPEVQYCWVWRAAQILYLLIFPLPSISIGPKVAPY